MNLLSYFKRKPDFIIGTPDNPYLLRWWIIPRNRFFNIYLHKFLRDDDDRALHDHPWASCSIILSGGYLEHLPGRIVKERKPGRIYFRRATAAHRIELYRNYYPEIFNSNRIRGRVWLPKIVPAWTLFITGPNVREWGFHCPQGWRHWTQFCDPENPGNVGKGCA